MKSRKIVDLTYIEIENLEKFGIRTTPPSFTSITTEDLHNPLPPIQQLTLEEIRRFNSIPGKHTLLKYVIVENGDLIVANPCSFPMTLTPDQISSLENVRIINPGEALELYGVARKLGVHNNDIIIFDAEGKLPELKIVLVKHPEVAGLRPVVAAGDLYIENGRIVKEHLSGYYGVDNWTGHYQCFGEDLPTLTTHVFRKNGFTEVVFRDRVLAEGCPKLISPTNVIQRHIPSYSHIKPSPIFSNILVSWEDYVKAARKMEVHTLSRFERILGCEPIIVHMDLTKINEFAEREYFRNKNIKIWSPDFGSSFFPNERFFKSTTPTNFISSVTKKTSDIGRQHGLPIFACWLDSIFEYEKHPERGILSAISNSSFNFGLIQVFSGVAKLLAIPPMLVIGSLLPAELGDGEIHRELDLPVPERFQSSLLNAEFLDNGHLIDIDSFGLLTLSAVKQYEKQRKDLLLNNQKVEENGQKSSFLIKPYFFDFSGGYVKVVTPYGSTPIYPLENGSNDLTSLSEEIAAIKISSLDSTPTELSKRDSATANPPQKSKGFGEIQFGLSIPSPGTIQLSISSINNALGTNVSISVQIDQQSMVNIFKMIFQGSLTKWHTVNLFGNEYEWKIKRSGGTKNCEVLVRHVQRDGDGHRKHKHSSKYEHMNHLRLKDSDFNDPINKPVIEEVVNRTVSELAVEETRKEIENLNANYNKCNSDEERQRIIDEFKKFQSIPVIAQFINDYGRLKEKNDVFNKVKVLYEEGHYLEAIKLCDNSTIFTKTEKDEIKSFIEKVMEDDQQRENLFKRNDLIKQLNNHVEKEEYDEAMLLCDSEVLNKDEQQNFKNKVEKSHRKKIKHRISLTLDTANQAVSLVNNACTLFHTISNSKQQVYAPLPKRNSNIRKEKVVAAIKQDSSRIFSELQNKRKIKRISEIHKLKM